MIGGWEGNKGVYYLGSSLSVRSDTDGIIDARTAVR